ncbi:MAG: tripartite tricarboxylate transporter substrate binding protein [Thermodesulfobacteriota bacterium]|nr:tripartite tricarboxylate transporter substrate binding protein [Thermodesulfobacteriota bacterium]
MVMVLFIFTIPVMAAEFPGKPVTLIVPWPPGGSTDVAMRALAEATSKHLGQPVVVANKPGGSGTVGGATMAATAKPDGYTVAQIPITIFRFPHMMKVTWDPLKDFTYIIHLTGYTFGVVVKADAPWETWTDFVAYAKANPGKVTYATPGAGTTLHITMEMFALKQGIKWIQVPMKGGAETTPAVLGGHVTATADSTGWAPQVDAGQLRLLVTWGNQRTKRWPQVPTLKDLGYGIVSNSPFGLAGPKGMDPKVVKILHDAFKKGMEDPAYLSMLDKLDMEPFYKNSEDYIKYVKEMVEVEKENVEKLGLKPR